MTSDKLNADKIVGTIFTIKDHKLLEQILVKHINDGTIDQIIKYIVDELNRMRINHLITGEITYTLSQAFFNISDRVPDIDSKLLLVRAVYLLLKGRRNDDGYNDDGYSVLIRIIPKSRELYAPFALISSLEEDPNLISDDNKFTYIKRLCVERVSKEKFDDLVKHDYFVDTLVCWEKWDKSSKYNDFITDIKKSDDKLLRLLERFFKENKKDRHGNKEIFRYHIFDKLVAKMDETKDKLEDIRKNNPDLYKAHKNSIDKYIDNYHTKDDIRYHFIDRDYHSSKWQENDS